MKSISFLVFRESGRSCPIVVGACIPSCSSDDDDDVAYDVTRAFAARVVFPGVQPHTHALNHVFMFLPVI